MEASTPVSAHTRCIERFPKAGQKGVAVTEWGLGWPTLKAQVLTLQPPQRRRHRRGSGPTGSKSLEAPAAMSRMHMPLEGRLSWAERTHAHMEERGIRRPQEEAR